MQMNSSKYFAKEFPTGKLYIVTQDYSTTDLVVYKDNLYEFDTVLSFTKYHTWTDHGVAKKQDFFKVIGEISPKASWVKDGDSFEEDEIQLVRICHDYDGNQGYCFHCERSKECGSQDFKVLIKCSNCKYFH